MKLDLECIAKNFGAHRALASVTLAIDEARALVLIGPSGGGKSTLLRIIGGLEIPDSGTFALNGTRVTFAEAALQTHRRTIGTVFQAFNLFPHLTALENITLPLEKVHGFSRADADATARAQLQRFHVEAHARKKPAELSGGQRQRVAIARALSIRPQLLLFDEPTSALDPEMTAEVLEAIDELRAEARDLILVTHHMAFARRIADRVAFIADGRVVESGNAVDVFDAPTHAATRAFLSKVLKY
jgi:polar amino acid transport system ATP-binding protein